MTNTVAIERVVAPVCTVGESPLWNAEEGAWYWVDIPARTIWRLDAASGALRNWTAAEMIACIAQKESGGMIAGMESGIFSLDLGDSEQVGATWLAAPDGLGAGMRFNDGRCDRQGRFWSGTMFMDMAAERSIGNLYRYTAPHGLSQAIVSGLLVQNGLAWSPDGRTMYLSDSHSSRQLIWAFDYDGDEGMPHNQRVFVDMNAYPGRPDGAAVDADGCYWICGNDGGCVLRFTPDGTLDRRIDLPMAKPSMCAFGGAKMDTMLVTSISAGKAEGDTWAGAVLLLRPGVSGIEETCYCESTTAA
ncbi:MAG TPA: SMP-30/gluconolactonase/LRE family protein [Burkholderiaceae bacterium]